MVAVFEVSRLHGVFRMIKKVHPPDLRIESTAKTVLIVCETALE